MSELSHPEVLWNPALEELLCNEAEKCSGLAWLHSKSEALYGAYNTRLQLPIIICSAVSGFASGVIPPSVAGGMVAIGSVSILVSVLGTINSFFAFAKRTEGHRISAVQYTQICRAIRIEMNLPSEQRMPPKVLLKWVKDDLKRLSETAPRVPDSVIERYKKEVMPHSGDASHPEITNGIESVLPYALERLRRNVSSPNPARLEIRVPESPPPPPSSA